MNVQLYAYLGIGPENQPKIYINAFQLNPLGTRVVKGMPLPDNVYNFCEKGGSFSESLTALQDLQWHFNEQIKGKRRSKKNESL